MVREKPNTHAEMSSQVWDIVVGTNGEGMGDRLKRVEENMVTKEQCEMVQREAAVDDREDRVDISAEIKTAVQEEFATKTRDPALADKDRRAKWAARISMAVGLTVLIGFGASVLGVRIKGGVRSVLQDWLDRPATEVVDE